MSSVEIHGIDLANQCEHKRYLGSADDNGVEVACREVIDNSIDEHMNGNGDTIIVYVTPSKGMVCVKDFARGIPVEDHPQHKGISTLEAVLTKAHTGGKFGYCIAA